MKQTLYLANFNHHESLKSEILGDQPIKMGHQILDIEMACLPQDFDRNLTELLLYHKLSHETLPLLKKSMSYQKHLADAIEMSLTLRSYQIPIQSLPNETPLDLEKKLILESAFELVPEFTVPENYDQVFYLETNMKHEHLHFLVSHKIHKLEIDYFEQENIEIKSALNRRYEIEGAFISYEKEMPLLVFPNNDSLHLYAAVRSRYKDTSTVQSLVTHSIEVYSHLVAYQLTKKKEHLMALLQFNLFSLNRQDLAHCQHTLEQEMYGDPRLSQIINQLNTEILTSNYQETLYQSFEFLRKKEIGNLLPLKRFLESKGHLYDTETHSFFVAHLSKLKTETIPEGYHTLETMPLKGAHKAVFFGLNAKNYPKIKSQTGLFDEVYRSKIKGFPSLNERTAYTISQKESCFKKVENCVFSFAQTSFEGKRMEPAFLISQTKSNNHTIWPMNENSKRNREINLSPESSKQLFFQDEALYTSISRIQLYMIDPLAFFYEVGLKLRRIELPSFDMRILGTLNHSFLEVGSVDYQAALTELEIPLSLENLMILRRNDDLMKRNQSILQLAQEQTEAKMIRSECEVKGSIEDVHFKGYIDRVDQLNEGVLLYDYKSSSHSLSMTNLAKGENLQLLAYANLYQRQEKAAIYGAFYFNLGFSKIESFTHHYKFSNGLERLTQERLHDEYLSKKRYSGWFFEDLAYYFDKSDHYVGMTTLKSQDIKITTLYDYQEVQKVLKDVLKQIQSLISKGILNPDQLDLLIDLDTYDYKKEKQA